MAFDRPKAPIPKNAKMPRKATMVIGLVAVSKKVDMKWPGRLSWRSTGMTASGVGCSATRSMRDAMNRSEEHTSELQSLMRISYAVFCLKKKQTRHLNHL